MRKQDTDHIDVKKLWQKLWNHRLIFLFVWIGTILVVGAGTYLLPCKWKSTIKIIPEYNLQEALAMKSIFTNLGNNVEYNAMGDAFMPQVYKEIVNDAQFLEGLTAEVVQDRDGKEWTVEQLYSAAETREQMYENMRNDIRCKLSTKDDIISISVVARDPVIAMQTANLTYRHLSAYISAYRQEKAQSNLNYYAPLKEQSSVYQTLYEVAQVKLEEHQAPFVVIRHAEVPIHKESPKRAVIVFIFLVLVTLGMTCYYWREDIKEWL
ncbi:MAG: Wzz/FepE/Etk N-terminal domain-containing protein [Paludibacteraceae bacterium]|nr:Wzz/FepE/Etk N-terminal domain-containing protein [Paludibacteraceae bacterium]